MGCDVCSVRMKEEINHSVGFVLDWLCALLKGVITTFKLSKKLWLYMYFPFLDVGFKEQCMLG